MIGRPRAELEAELAAEGYVLRSLDQLVSRQAEHQEQVDRDLAALERRRQERRARLEEALELAAQRDQGGTSRGLGKAAGARPDRLEARP